MYFRGVNGYGFVQSQWLGHVREAQEKYGRSMPAQPAAPAGANPESATVEGIRAKLKAGKKLSPTEMEFLRQHEPELYAKALRVSLDRETYAATLRRCEDREQVERVRACKGIQMASAAPRMDPEEAQMTLSAALDAERAYLGSAGYARLPEKRKAGGAR